jgi:hypothetical protein
MSVVPLLAPRCHPRLEAYSPHPHHMSKSSSLNGISRIKLCKAIQAYDKYTHEGNAYI